MNNQKITYEISDNNICFIVDYNFYKSYENDERHVENKLLESNELELDFNRKNYKDNIPIFGILYDYIDFLIKKNGFDSIKNQSIELDKLLLTYKYKFNRGTSSDKILFLNKNNIYFDKILNFINFNYNYPTITFKSKLNTITYSNMIQSGDYLTLIK